MDWVAAGLPAAPHPGVALAASGAHLIDLDTQTGYGGRPVFVDLLSRRDSA